MSIPNNDEADKIQAAVSIIRALPGKANESPQGSSGHGPAKLRKRPGILATS